jgi:predicted enzyme related to lactoylglutathione lyase
MSIKFNSLYLSVKDMDRALKFYEELLNKAPASVDERMSVFDIGGVSLLLYNPDSDDEKVEFGNNVVPNFEVDDVQSILRKIKSVGGDIVLNLHTVGNFKLFQAKDPEGNVIEFYEVV